MTTHDLSTPASRGHFYMQIQQAANENVLTCTTERFRFIAPNGDVWVVQLSATDEPEIRRIAELPKIDKVLVDRIEKAIANRPHLSPLAISDWRLAVGLYGTDHAYTKGSLLAIVRLVWADAKAGCRGWIDQNLGDPHEVWRVIGDYGHTLARGSTELEALTVAVELAP